MIRRVLSTCAVLALVAVGILLMPAPVVDEAVFHMREVSAFEEAMRAFEEDLSYSLMRGHRQQCSTEPDVQVSAYPKLTSQNPFYGCVAFDKGYREPGPGIRFCFVVDESGGTGTGYDRLIFDVNRDLDLTNDGVLAPMKDPPPAVTRSWSVRRTVYFDYLTVPIDHGPALGTRPFRILPRLVVWESGQAAFFFVSTVARKGKIMIAGDRYEALLGQPRLISGRFDRHFAGLDLNPIGSSQAREHWVGSDWLGAMRKVDGTYYCLSATPLGDKLTVRPYRGDFGVFEVGAGARDITKVAMHGSLAAKTTAVAVGEVKDGNPEKTRRCRLPVGDYLSAYLMIDYGRLGLSISENYHSDGYRSDRRGRPSVFGIKIRKDRPYVLDFSNKPAVMFISPAKEQRFAPGDTINVRAVLTDPGLDMMIRGLKDMTRKERKHSHVVGRSLEPTATISDSRGRRVAQGVMPFG